MSLNVFLDSSALAKRYLNETGSDQVQGIFLAASTVGLSVICFPEIVSGLCRLRREGRISAQQYAENKRALVQDVEDSVIILITPQVVIRTIELLERWPLRSADALHVACAAEWGADLFVSADQRQAKAARSYGLRVEALGIV